MECAKMQTQSGVSGGILSAMLEHGMVWIFATPAVCCWEDYGFGVECNHSCQPVEMCVDLRTKRSEEFVWIWRPDMHICSLSVPELAKLQCSPMMTWLQCSPLMINGPCER
eukprot:4985663-Amphidinium_carterae.1